jgi:trimeric autotransporter adhesin
MAPIARLCPAWASSLGLLAGLQECYKVYYTTKERSEKPPTKSHVNPFTMKTPLVSSLQARLLPAAFYVLFTLVAAHARADVWYWDPNGLGPQANGIWDTLSGQWATNSAFTNAPVVWNPAMAAGFPVGSTNVSALTISVNSTVGFAGLFNGLNAGAGVTNLTLNGSGTLTLSLPDQGFWVGQSYYNTIVKVPILGSGGPQTQSSGSHYFAVPNGYSGRTYLATSAGFNFNNSYAFGYGQLTNGVTTTVLATPVNDSAGNAFTPTAALTITNAVATCGGSANSSLIFVGIAGAPTTFSGPWTMAGASTTSFTMQNQPSGTTVTISGPISGVSAFRKAGAGALVLNGTNTFTGPLTNAAGTLTVNSIADSGTSAAGLGTTLTLAGGTVSYSGTSAATTSRAVWQTAASTLDVPSGNLTLSGQFKNSSSANALTKTGSGTLIFSGSADNASLGVTVSGGTLQLNKSSSSSVHALGSTTTINSGAKLQLSGSGGDQIYSGVNVTNKSGGVFDANGKSEGMTTLGLSGTGISSGGALINSAAATTATITTTGTVGFPLGADTSLGGAGNLTLVGVVGGPFALTKVGTGTVVLNSTNTYTGNTTVSAGTLEIVTNTGVASATVTVASSATLKLDSAIALKATTALVLNAGTPSVNLNFLGGQQVASLSLDGGGTTVAAGTWGAPGSGAVNPDSRFTGTGILNVGIAPPSSVALSSSGTPATYGTAVTFTSAVSGSGATPTGSITFRDGATVLGAVPLDGTGTATFTTAATALNAATHALTAAYSGDVNYGAALASFSQVVSKAPLTITANNQTKTYGQTLTFGAGSTQFTSSGLQGGDTIGTVTLACSGGAATATVIVSPYTITPSAATGGAFTAANYTMTYAPGQLTVTPAPLTVTATGLLTYGNDPSTAVYTPAYAGFQNSDPVSVVSGSATYSTDATATSYLGTNYLAHVVDTGTLTAANYSFTAGADGVTTLTNRPLWVTNALASDKVYDTTTAAAVDLSGAGLTNLVNGDEASVSLITSNAVGAFASKAAGTRQAVTISGLSLAGDLGTNYVLIQPATALATITPAPLTVSATGVDKTYDGTIAATVTLAATPLDSDSVTPTYASASFAGKAVGTGLAVSVSGIALTGTDAGNYTPNSTASTTAGITPRSLTVTATGVDKVYDGDQDATVTLTDNKVAGDDVTESYALAAFADKAAASGKAVSVTGISLSGGADAGNYALANTTASTMANITQRPLTVTATAANKAYDGTANASVTLADNRLAGDAVTESYASALFADKNIGPGKPVTVSDLSLSGGAEAANYVLANTTATATADITGVTLTVAGAQASDKVYDGTTNATLLLSNAALVGVAGTDDVTLITTNAVGAFADKNVGTAKPVTLSGLQIAGADAGNYSLTQPMTNASISQATLAVTATGVNKVYDGTMAATVTLADDKLASDDVSASYTSASFADANVGTAKAVSVSGISISGTAAGNYSLADTEATAAADIIGAASSTMLTSSLNPSTETSNVTFTATVSSGAGLPTGDVVFLANGVPFSTNTLAAGVATASTTSLPLGTNTVVAAYATQANWLLSSDTLNQEVQSAVILSQTNAVLSIAANGDGIYTLTLLGTPGASYYVVSSGDLTAPSAAWSALTYSTNTAPSPSGQWSVLVSNAAPAFYRSVAVHPAAP